MLVLVRRTAGTRRACSPPSGPSGRTCVFRGPFERVVRCRLPSGGGAGPVVSAFELEVLGEGGRVLVVPERAGRVPWARKPAIPAAPSRPVTQAAGGESHSHAGRQVQVSRIALFSRSSASPSAPDRRGRRRDGNPTEASGPGRSGSACRPRRTVRTVSRAAHPLPSARPQALFRQARDQEPRAAWTARSSRPPLRTAAEQRLHVRAPVPGLAGLIADLWQPPAPRPRGHRRRSHPEQRRHLPAGHQVFASTARRDRRRRHHVHRGSSARRNERTPGPAPVIVLAAPGQGPGARANRPVPVALKMLLQLAD
jgi:hypothetical protein